jgi:hypothetical protein
MALLPSDLMPTSHCFCVNTQKRVYYFCCDTAEDLVRWQRALQSLMPHNQNRACLLCSLFSRVRSIFADPTVGRHQQDRTTTSSKGSRG